MRERCFRGQRQRVQHAAVVGQHQRLEGEREGAAAAQRKRRPVQRAAAAAAGRAVSRGKRGTQIRLRILRAMTRAGTASARAVRKNAATRSLGHAAAPRAELRRRPHHPQPRP